MTIKWKVNDDEHGWVAKVPPFSLSVGKSSLAGGDRGVFWQCHWQDSWENGTAYTVGQAKAAAIACAVRLCRKALEQLQGGSGTVHPQAPLVPRATPALDASGYDLVRPSRPARDQQLVRVHTPAEFLADCEVLARRSRRFCASRPV